MTGSKSGGPRSVDPQTVDPHTVDPQTGDPQPVSAWRDPNPVAPHLGPFMNVLALFHGTWFQLCVFRIVPWHLAPFMRVFALVHET